jgi:hypothetical protein
MRNSRENLQQFVWNYLFSEYKLDTSELRLLCSRQCLALYLQRMRWAITSGYVTYCPEPERTRDDEGERVSVWSERGLQQVREPHPGWRHEGWLSIHTHRTERHERQGLEVSHSFSVLSTCSVGHSNTADGITVEISRSHSYEHEEGNRLQYCTSFTITE